eukprot:3881115-Pyramimonas_sp.AAC.1
MLCVVFPSERFRCSPNGAPATALVPCYGSESFQILLLLHRRPHISVADHPSRVPATALALSLRFCSFRTVQLHVSSCVMYGFPPN